MGIGMQTPSSSHADLSRVNFPVYDFIGQRALTSPNDIALEDYASGEQLSYQQLNTRSNQAANVLEDLGLKNENTLAILCLNCSEFFEILFACGKSGIILVPLNWRQTAVETKTVIDDSLVNTIFYDDFNAALAEELAALCPQISIIPLHLLDDSESNNENKRKIDSSTITSYTEARNAAKVEYSALTRSLDQVWYLLYTSGTTGKPKAVIQSFGMCIANYVNTVQAIDLTSQDSTALFLPIFHTGGINLYALPTLIGGGKVFILPKFEADTLIDLIEKDKLSVLFAVPAIYRALHEHAKFSKLSFSSIRSLGCGGAPIQEYILQEYANHGVTICNGFGMTETGPMTFLMDKASAAKKIGSIGTVKLLTQARIVNEQGEDLPAGEAGELLLAGANITPGYWGNPDATQKTFDKDGWMHTGDIAKCDEDGYFYIIDRIKDMYISGGENVYPAEVETVLEQHPKILEAVVVGIPDNKWGEVGYAFLRVQDDYHVDAQELTEFSRQRLAGYKTPHHFQTIEDFPRTAAGKVKKNELREIAVAQL